MRYLRYFVLATFTSLLLLFVHSFTPVSSLESLPQSLGNGTIRTYVELDENDQIQELGVIFTEASLSGLPDHPVEVILPLPDEASGTGFDHIAIDWRSHGHDPSPIYGVPHFDVHAYTLTPEQRQGITLEGTDLEKAYITPDSEQLPAGYILAPDSAEPAMGSHWIDPTSEEFQGAPNGFSHTLIYGFYNGEMAFLEPMVSLNFLKTRQTIEKTFAVPERYSREGIYPSAYKITYNEATGEHIVAFTGFAQL